jgi:hypothetical protein
MQWNFTSLEIWSCEWVDGNPKSLSLSSCYFSHWFKEDGFVLVYDCRGPLMHLGCGWHVGVHVLEGCGRVLSPDLLPGSREYKDTHDWPPRPTPNGLLLPLPSTWSIIAFKMVPKGGACTFKSRAYRRYLRVKPHQLTTNVVKSSYPVVERWNESSNGKTFLPLRIETYQRDNVIPKVNMHRRDRWKCLSLYGEEFWQNLFTKPKGILVFLQLLMLFFVSIKSSRMREIYENDCYTYVVNKTKKQAKWVPLVRIKEVHDVQGHQWTSVDVSGHRWTSVDISGYQWMSVSSVDIGGHQWTPVDIGDISGHQWTLVGISGYQEWNR